MQYSPSGVDNFKGPFYLKTNILQWLQNVTKSYIIIYHLAHLGEIRRIDWLMVYHIDSTLWTLVITKII